MILLPAFLAGQTTALQSRTVAIDNPENRTLIEIDLPANLSPARPTTLIYYALPNTNTIAWTRGRKLREGDDWHYDIQHIEAQTRYLRKLLPERNLVVVYLANYDKAWPAWKRARPDGPKEIRRIVDSITGSFAEYKPDIILNSHSGGGSLLFGYIDGGETIPDNIKRIAFIDSNYGFEDSVHTPKLVQWLQRPGHSLSVLAYNDSVVIYNGKPLVSPTGGTWYRSKLMKRSLEPWFPFQESTDTGFCRYKDFSGKIDIRLKTNQEGKIYHTELCARNGFIETIIGGTKDALRSEHIFWGPRAYTAFIE